MAHIYDRQNKKYVVEKPYKETTLKLLYNTKPGRILLKTVVARPWYSKLTGLYRKSDLSHHLILPFIEEYKINTKDYDLSKMKSFNDFFIRKRKIKLENKNPKDLLAIADAKLSVYDITRSLRLKIKNSNYSLAEILGSEELARKFAGGKCLVYRLSVDDYHRYHYLDNGFIRKRYRIKGELHTIRPISEKYNVFSRNTREITVMKTDNFGEVIQVEVGATLVGCIVNKKEGILFNRLDEKGYFEFGGSTIILLMQNNIKLDKDIEILSKRNLEAKVRIGEKIGQLI